MPSRALLCRLRKNQLVDLCQKHGLNTDGTKEDLLNRLCEIEEVVNSDDSTTILDDLPAAGTSNSTLAMFSMMKTMMESQNLTMKQLAEQQVEDRKLIME